MKLVISFQLYTDIVVYESKLYGSFVEGFINPESNLLRIYNMICVY